MGLASLLCRTVNTSGFYRSIRMLRRTLSSIMLVASLFAVGGREVLAEEETPQSHRIMEIENRMKQIEEELLSHQAERFRQKHALEFSDAEAIPLRLESKSAEKELLDLRRAYETRLRVVDEEYRRLHRELRASHKQLRDKEMLMRSAQRELAAALSGSGNESDRTVIADSLRRDVADYQSEIDEIRQANTALLQLLEERKQAITESDAEAFTLKNKMDTLEPQYRETYGLLHQSLDMHEDVTKLDAVRQALAVELQALRREKSEALNEMSKP